MIRINKLVVALVAIGCALLAAACEMADVSASRLEVAYEEAGGQCPVHGVPVRVYNEVRMMPGIEGPPPMQPPAECDEPWLHTDDDHDLLCDFDHAQLDLGMMPEPEPVSNAGVAAPIAS